ncbi:MAG: response regulator transcription factor [Lachnospira sp.]|nr:response regulator transcription factor [Lachnospira sp.]
MSAILVLEDDEYIRNGLCRLLGQKGYFVEGVGSVKAFFEKISDGKEYDMYLVDVCLPDGNGFDVCRKLRETSQAVIIFLTSCDDEESVIRGLDSGADDYVTKPFRVAELLSRIQANLRRMMYKKKEDITEEAGLKIDLERYEITKKGECINLSPVEFELLRLLMANKGLIVRREIILEKLWDKSGNFVEDGTLTVAISRLKSKLGNGKDGKSYIETIRGVGYRWR